MLGCENLNRWDLGLKIVQGNYCEGEPMCCFVRSYQKNVMQVDGDEMVENS